MSSNATMFACVDVDYREATGHAVAAAVLFERWSDAEPRHALTATVSDVEPYVPGSFYLRELPCILTVLQRVDIPLDALLVDGHVWLGEGKPGLRAHVFDALGGRVPVVGVAKNAFGESNAIHVLRGSSESPLYVTAVGMPASVAAEHIRSMHGEHRIPTLLKAVDHLSRASPVEASNAT